MRAHHRRGTERDVPAVTEQWCVCVCVCVSVGEDWNLLLADCSVEPPFCSTQASGVSDCGSFWLAHVYFYSFWIFGNYGLLSLYTATLLDNFLSVFARDPASSLHEKDLDRCGATQSLVQLWRPYTHTRWCSGCWLSLGIARTGKSGMEIGATCLSNKSKRSFTASRRRLASIRTCTHIRTLPVRCFRDPSCRCLMVALDLPSVVADACPAGSV